MLSTVRSKSFLVGFSVGLLLFLAANIYTYDDGAGVFRVGGAVRMTECFDCIKRFGWPFRLHQSGTMMHVNEILWMGLSADIFIAVFVSSIVGALTYLKVNARSRSRALEEQR
jgi:hypothetical protein